jgi:hypothetical protein
MCKLSQYIVEYVIVRLTHHLHLAAVICAAVANMTITKPIVVCYSLRLVAFQ